MISEPYRKQLQPTAPRTGELPVLRSQVRQSRERLDLSAIRAQIPRRELENSTICTVPERWFLVFLCPLGLFGEFVLLLEFVRQSKLFFPLRRSSHLKVGLP